MTKLFYFYRKSIDMKNILLAFLFILTLISCKDQEQPFESRTITHVTIKPLLEDSLLNVRALEIDNKGAASFATSLGKIGSISNDKANESAHRTFQLKHDTIIPNFRSLSVTENASFALSIISPALLYKIEKDSIKLVYKETHPDAFYDAMTFWNNQEGIAVGDSIDGCLSIIITRNGGETWTKLSCDVLPKGATNEGAFAASDTNIVVVDDKTWIATTAGRIYYSPDKGRSWDVIETPIVKEKETEGIYSMAFYDALNGFAIGGDYTKPADSSANKIRTQDGGKTWQLVAQNRSPGYRSCVQYMPNRRGQELVSVGFKGIDYSNDSGTSWVHLSDEGFYTIRFVNDSVAYAAGRGRVSKLTFK